MQKFVMCFNSGATENSITNSDGLDILADLIQTSKISIEKAKFDLKKSADNILLKN